MYSLGVGFLLTDQVGSLRAVADTSGTIVKKIDYDSFGNIIADSNPAFSVPFGFAGGLHDRDTGLVRFGARDYSPELGRWTAKDPLDFAGGDTNLYAYVLNDPINLVDPMGLAPPGMNFFTWWAARVVGGVVTGIPMTVGAGIGIFSPKPLDEGEDEMLKHAKDLDRILGEYAKNFRELQDSIEKAKELNRQLNRQIGKCP